MHRSTISPKKTKPKIPNFKNIAKTAKKIQTPKKKKKKMKGMELTDEGGTGTCGGGGTEESELAIGCNTDRSLWVSV